MRATIFSFTKLRPRMVLVLGTVLFLLAILGYYISRAVLLKSVLKIQQNLINENYERVLNIFQNELARLKTMALDWGHWDDTYNFALNKNENYVKSNLSNETFINNKWSAYIVKNTKLKTIYLKAFDIENDREMSLSPADLHRYFYPSSPLFKEEKNPDTKGGYALFHNQLQFIGVTTIQHSDHTGPTVGYVIIMRPLTKAHLEDFSSNLKLPLIIQYVSPRQVILPNLLDDNREITISENSIRVQILLRDINQIPIAIIKFNMPRNVYKYSEQAINFFLILISIMGAVVLLTLGMLLYFLIIRREKFNKQITHIAHHEDYSHRVNITGQDELNSMAAQVNYLLGIIEASHQALKKKMHTIVEINKELQKLDAENRSIIENAPEPIIIIDAQAN